MLSTRFTGKLSKWGNYFGIVNTILSGTIDYILGNKAAIITYPVTFLIYTFAIKKWELARRQTQPNEPKTAKIGSHHHFNHRLPICLCDQLYRLWGKMNLLAYVTTIAFALSLIANALNALKLTTQWGFWLIYNFVQLTKDWYSRKLCQYRKYIFYILNAIGALFVWNDEEVKQ